MSKESKTPRKKARAIMPATRMLQSRIGAGKIKPEKIEKAEGKIKAVKGRIDLRPFAETHMKEIKVCLEDIKNGSVALDITEEISRSIMNFKGNVGIFSEGPLVGLAMIMLNWVESLVVVDQDVSDVLHGYYVTLDQIFSGKLKDAKTVELIVKEMEAACGRYFSKHPELRLTQVMDNSKAFYLDQSDQGNVKVGLGGELGDELNDDALIGSDD